MNHSILPKAPLKFVSAVALIVSAGGCSFAAPSVAEICAREDIECAEVSAGTIVGKPGTTSSYIDGLESAATTFEHYFGQPAPQVAVLLGEVLDPTVREGVANEFDAVLPWLSIADREALVARTVRAQIQRQRPDLEGDALDAVVKQSVDSTLNANSSPHGNTGAEDVHQGVFAHELGHMFFIETYWPDDSLNVLEPNIGDISRYAGPAPDWLDEMAAVLMENTALTNGRVDGLESAAAGDVFEALWPLESYFEMTHPAFEQARALIRARQNSAEGRARGGVVILSRDDLAAQSDGRSPVNFYVQSRGFADFMIETTGELQIFADIAHHIADGGSMKSWLSASGDRYNLPTSPRALQDDFGQWVSARYGKGSDTDGAVNTTTFSGL